MLRKCVLARIQLRYELNKNETCSRVLLDSEIKEGKIWISEITTVYKTRVVVVSHRILEDISPQDVGMRNETILSDALKVIRDYAFAEPHENVENPCRGSACHVSKTLLRQWALPLDRSFLNHLFFIVFVDRRMFIVIYKDKTQALFQISILSLA